MVNLDWDHLSFSYTKTNSILISTYENGEWSEVRSFTNDNVTMSSFAGALHYGVSCFEGLKVFRGIDGKIRIFRPEENARRLQGSARALFMPEPPEDLFLSMCLQLTRENAEFIPPYGHSAALYIRPVLYAHNAYLGVGSSQHVTLAMLCTPVGAYVGDMLEPITAAIARNYDRAAAFGLGRYKVSANYACSLHALHTAQIRGYKAALHLDPREHKYIDEFNSSNFFAIKGNSYVTPLSDTVLPSITNKSLQVAARDLGMDLEIRKIEVPELAEFDEVGECGTAVVITPISYIDDRPYLEAEEYTRYSWPIFEMGCGPKSYDLYKYITGVQFGLIPDKHDWCQYIDL